MGEEIGDAYISVHADTKAAKAELAAFAKKASADFDKMEDKAGSLRDRLNEVAKSAKKFGDDDTFKKATEQLDGLDDKMKQTRKSLSLLNIEDERWGQTVEHTNRSLRVREGNLKKLEAIVRKASASENFFATSMRNGVTRVKKMDRALTSLAKRHHSHFNIMEKITGKIGKSWARMDSTVRLVIGLIAAAAGPMATLGSLASSALLSIAAAAGAAVAALAPLIGVLGPLIFGLTQLKDLMFDKKGNFNLKELAAVAPEAAKGIENLRQAFKKIDASAFGKAINEPLANFTNTLADKLEFDTLAHETGLAFAQILDGLTATMEGAWVDFTDAMEGPLTNALGNIGAAFTGPLLSGFLDFLTATAPLAEKLSEIFLVWAENFGAAMAEGKESGTLLETFEGFLPALESVLNLFGAIGDVIGTVFSAGQGPGTTLLNTITDLVRQLDEWFGTFEGQAALNQFFTNMGTLMPSLFTLIGAVGQALAALVTPQMVQMTSELLEGLALFMPILSEILGVISELGILNILVDALNMIGAALEPIMPTLSLLAQVLGEAFGKVMAAAAPIIMQMGEVLGVLAEALTPVIAALGDGLVVIFEALAPAIQPLLGVIKQLLPLLGGALVQIIQALAPIIAELAVQFAGIATQLLTALMPVIEALIPIIVSLVPVLVQAFIAFNPILRIITLLVPAIMPLITMLADLVTWVLNLVAPLIDMLVPALVEVFKWLGFTRALGPVISGVFKGIGAAAKWVGGIFGKMAKFIKDGVAWFKLLFEALKGGGGAGGAGGIFGFFAKLGNVIRGIAGIFGKVVGAIVNFFKNLIAGVVEFVSMYVQWFTALGTRIWGAVSGFVTRIWTSISGFFTRLIQGVVQFVTAYVQFWVSLGTRIWSAVSGFATRVFSAFSSLVSRIVTAVSGFVSRVVQFWIDLGTRIGTAVSNFVTRVKNTFQGMIDNVSSKVSGFVDKITGFFSGLPGKIKSFFTGLADTIKGPFEAAFGAIARLWNNSIGKLSWTAPSWIPKIGGKTISVPKIPGFEFGGIVDQDGLYRAGEKGKPEAVVPLNQPLGMVDPSVRWLSAIAQGKGTTNSWDRSITIAPGAIAVSAPEANPELVAASVMDRIVAMSR